MRYLLLSIIIISLVGILMIPNAFAEVSTMVTLDLQSSILEKEMVMTGEGLVEGNINSAIVTVSGQLHSTEHYITDAPIKLVFIVLPDGQAWTEKWIGNLWFNEKDHYEVITDDEGKFNVKILVRKGVMSFIGERAVNVYQAPEYINDLHQLPLGRIYGEIEMGVQAVFDGGSTSSRTVLEPSKSQIEFFSITSSQNIVHEVTTSSSQSSASSVGGPTFLKLEIETDKTVVTVSGKLTDKATKRFVVRDEVITLIPSGFFFPKDTSACISYYLPNCILKISDRGEFAVRFTLPVGEDYSVQAVFNGNNQWDPSKSLIQFAVISQSSTSSQPSLQAPTQTPFWFAFSASSGFETGSLLVICAIIIGPVAAFAVIRRRKKRIQEMDDENEYDREQKEAEDDEDDEYERERKQWERERMEQRQREQEQYEQAQREQEQYEQAQREREKAKKRRQKGTHYDVLGVPEDASQKAIKDAYRKLSLKWHPDKNKSKDASKRFNQITEAYGILSNKDERKKYDADL